jgi:ABC-type enterochelin transport system permease subunit
MNKDEIQEAIYKNYSCFSNYIQKIVSFDDYKFSLIQLFKLYMSAKIINILNEKFILLIITNIIMFYAPLENYSDHFLFKAKMAVIQTIEGTIGLISCLIPKYEEPKINNK